jgi:hypothetical protein
MYKYDLTKNETVKNVIKKSLKKNEEIDFEIDFENFSNLETEIPEKKPRYSLYDVYSEDDYSEDDLEYDSDEDYDENGDLKIKKWINGRYEWGFDLTDFNSVDGNEDGVLKFKRLIRKFGLTNYSMDEGFTWSNEDDSLILITTNHPINGKNDEDDCEREPGYLGFVAVTCKSAELLGEFLKAFRCSASYIKGEANYREYF